MDGRKVRDYDTCQNAALDEFIRLGALLQSVIQFVLKGDEGIETKVEAERQTSS